MKIHKSKKAKTIIITYINRRVQVLDNILFWRWDREHSVKTTKDTGLVRYYHDVAHVSTSVSMGKKLLYAKHPKIGAHLYNSPIQIVEASTQKQKRTERKAWESLPSRETIRKAANGQLVNTGDWVFGWVPALKDTKRPERFNVRVNDKKQTLTKSKTKN